MTSPSSSSGSRLLMTVVGFLLGLSVVFIGDHLSGQQMGLISHFFAPLQSVSSDLGHLEPKTSKVAAIHAIPSTCPSLPPPCPASAAAPGQVPAGNAPSGGSNPSAQCPDFERWRPHLENHFKFWRNGSITRSMLRQDYLISARIQVINRRVYWKLLPGNKYVARTPAVISFLMHAIQTHPDVPVPDVEFVLETYDFAVGYQGHEPARILDLPPQPPFFCMSREPAKLAVPVPDFSFWSWGENGEGREKKMGYTDLMKTIAKAADEAPYNDRIPKTVFRGQGWNDDRQITIKALREHADLTDIVTTLESKTDKLSAAAFARYKVQLYIAGNGYSARFKYLLQTGSPVIHYSGSTRGRMEEWFYPLLRPHIDYIPVYSPMQARDTLVELLTTEDGKKRGEEIGAQGRAFAETELTVEKAACYWLYLLQVYAPRLAEPVELEPGMETLDTPGAPVYARYFELFPIRGWNPDLVGRRDAHISELARVLRSGEREDAGLFDEEMTNDLASSSSSSSSFSLTSLEQPWWDPRVVSASPFDPNTDFPASYH